METKQSFSLRKLSVGLASVLIGISFLNGTKANVVKADTNESPKENVQDAQDKNNEDMQSAILKNTSLQNADAQNTTQTDHTHVNADSSTSAVQDTSADQVGQVAGAERGDSSARETRTSQLDTNKTKPAVLTKLALNPSRTKTLSLQSLQENKIAANTTNGGFDEAIWGKLDVNNWTGQAENGVYQLTGYTGDLEHIIVPNSADFATAGKDIGNLQVGINSDITHSWFEKGSPKTIAFSKTGDQKVKAVGTNWTSAFTGYYNRYRNYEGKSHELNKFDGNNLDVSNVTNMMQMFDRNQISDLNGLANWKTDNVTDMSNMFDRNQISDLNGLANWKTDNVTDMDGMFYNNKISDLNGLANWNISNVADMSWMFNHNQISDLNGLANWKTDNVTNMSRMFGNNQINDLSPLANWNINNVTDMSWMFYNNKISDLSPLANWKTDKVTDMNSMFQNNQISDLSPLANWKTDKVTDMNGMFEFNQIKDLSPLANWKTDKVINMANMFALNPIQYADFTKWNFDQVKYFGTFISQSNDTIILVKNAQDQAKLAGKSQTSLYSSTLYPVVNVPSNNLHFGDTDTSAMPTILIATNKPEVRQQLLSLINAKVSDYQKSHPDDTVTPAVPLDNLIELADLANAKFNVVPKVTTVTVHFIDDTDNLHAPKDYQLANQKMNTTLNSSNLKDDQDLANFKFTSEPAFTVTSLNPTWTVHLVHGLIEVTDPNQLQTTSTRTIVFNLPDKPETIVQTIGYTRTGMQDLITKQITYTNWVLDASRSNVTVDNQLSSLYAAYDPNSVSEDGTLVNFAPIKIPTKAGYKPVLQTVRPNMLSFIFMPIAKPPVEVNLDTPEKFTANDTPASLLPTWHLVENNMPDYTYTLTNTINSLNLPKIKDYKLYLVNKDSQDNSVAFTYLKDNNLKYLFKIKFINDSFEFSVKNVDKDVISVYKFNNLKDLDKFLVEFVTAA